MARAEVPETGGLKTMTKECEQKNQKNQPDPEKVFRAIAMILTARGEARVTVKSIRRVKRDEAAS